MTIFRLFKYLPKNGFDIRQIDLEKTSCKVLKSIIIHSDRSYDYLLTVPKGSLL